ncbi:FixH family protein [Roseiarcaceae bacterium H3SJ34-1]|uniref:FixH family protein n=1 Tax=Terripilifer ovatus TaxID=3032367 RepID=UPI003AB91CE4|nr:FixH family protein [Roseiarcaceae bacterium H3SJ34-1]
MKILIQKRAAVAALVAFAWVGIAVQAWAGADDYDFQLVTTEIKKGDTADIAVRLIDKRSGKPVPDAVIVTTRIDMGPDGMEMMTAPIEPTSSTEPGIYHFKVKLMMVGSWALTLAARIPGQSEFLQKKLVFKAVL